MSRKNWKKQKGIRMFVMDVDGTLTDGRTYYSSKGETMKEFNMRDGMGLDLLKKAKIVPVMLTKEKSKIVKALGKKLKLAEVHTGVKDKKRRLENVAFKYKLWLDLNVAYIGDDVNDIKSMKAVALAFAPSDAELEVKDKVPKLIICQREGGRGCVREAIEYVLRYNKAGLKPKLSK